jgi:hypothetical protein
MGSFFEGWALASARARKIVNQGSAALTPETKKAGVVRDKKPDQIETWSGNVLAFLEREL